MHGARDVQRQWRCSCFIASNEVMQLAHETSSSKSDFQISWRLLHAGQLPLRAVDE